MSESVEKALVETFHLDTFVPLLNQTFQITGPDHPPIEMVLLEATGKQPVPRFERFSLVFRGPGGLVLPTRTYAFEHPSLGSFELFLSAFEQDAEGVYYESVFNRLLPAAPRSGAGQ